MVTAQLVGFLVEDGSHSTVLGLKQLPQGYGPLRILRNRINDGVSQGVKLSTHQPAS